MSQFNVARDSNLTPTFGIGFSNGVNFQLIGDAADFPVTIPTPANFGGRTINEVLINISKGQDVFITKSTRNHGTDVVTATPVNLPLAGALSPTINQALNPSLRIDLAPGDILNFRSRDNADVQLEYFTKEAGPFT